MAPDTAKSTTTAEITWEDLLRVLEERPEWLERVRQVVLTRELLSLPGAVHELVEAHRRGEERLTRVEAAIQGLAEAQWQSEERLARLEATVQELVEVQRRHEERLARLEATVQELVEVQRRISDHLLRLELIVENLVGSVNALADSLRTLSSDMARLKGFYLEMNYREKASAYFGALLRSIRVMVPTDIEDLLEQHLTPKEIEDLVQLDLIVSGRLRYHPQRPEVMLALEISATVDRDDIRRARERALLLRKAGFPAIPAVAGVYVPPEARQIAQAEHVVVFEDGRTFFWEEMLQFYNIVGAPEPVS